MAINWKDDGDQKPVDMFSGKFPQGLRVLIVDENPTCLRILEKKLQHFKYKVTKCERAEKALSLLRENKNRFDIVISDVQMPDIDGFQFLLQVGSEINLPIIVISADDSVKSVIEGMKSGACDYLIKPIKLESAKTIYKHVAKKALEHTTMNQSNLEENAENSCSVAESSLRDPNKRKNLEADESNNNDDDKDDNDHISTLKKPRVVWSVDLHNHFVSAVRHLGLDKAVPKKILELMNVPWLTRENVASHLQKYRMFLKRTSEHQDSMNRPFISHQEVGFCSVGSSSLNGNGAYQGAANPGAGGVTMALYPRTRVTASELQQHLNLLKAIPLTVMETKQLVGNGMNVPQQCIHADPAAAAANGQNGSSHAINHLISPAGQPALTPGGHDLPDLPLNHDATEFSRKDFHFGNMEESNIISNRDTEGDDVMFDNVFWDKTTDDWDLDDIDFSSLPESVVSITQDFSSLQTNESVNACTHGNPMIFPTDEDMEINNIDEDMSNHFTEQEQIPKVKSEFPEIFNSLLDQQENVSMAGDGFGFDGYSIDNELLSF